MRLSPGIMPTTDRRRVIRSRNNNQSIPNAALMQLAAEVISNVSLERTQIRAMLITPIRVCYKDTFEMTGRLPVSADSGPNVNKCRRPHDAGGRQLTASLMGYMTHRVRRHWCKYEKNISYTCWQASEAKKSPTLASKGFAAIRDKSETGAAEWCSGTRQPTEPAGGEAGYH